LRQIFILEGQKKGVLDSTQDVEAASGKLWLALFQIAGMRPNKIMLIDRIGTRQSNSQMKEDKVPK
jgi:hypothetical protein